MLKAASDLLPHLVANDLHGMFRFMAIDGAPVNQKAGWFVHRNEVFVLIQNGK